MRRRYAFVGAFVAVSLIIPVVAQSSSTISQQQDKPQDTVRITTNLVQVDVIVTDKSGQHVIDLKPEDFEILEDGKRRQITNFSYIEAGSTPSAQPVATDVPSDRQEIASDKKAISVMPARLEGPVRRTVALVVDDLGLSFESIGFVRKALGQYVNEQMQPTDRIAILKTSAGIGTLQQFTSDKTQLNAAIERVRWYPAGRSGTEVFAPAADVADDFTDGPELTEILEREREGVYAAGTLNSVGSIIQGLSEMPGRKSVLLFSEAFRLFSTQGRNERLLLAMRRLSDRANAAGVTIYTIDASGLQPLTGTASDKAGGVTFTFTPGQIAAAEAAFSPRARAAPPPLPIQRADSLSAQAERDSVAAFRKLEQMMQLRDAQHYESQSVLSYLADRTGGLFIRNRNDLGAGVQEIMNDQRGFYLIGFRPEPSTVDATSAQRRLHHLSVKVKRAGLKVRGRNAYAGITTDERRPQRGTREAQLTAALVSPFVSGAVPVRLTTLFGLDPNSGPFLRSLLHVDARGLSFSQEADGTRKANLDILAAAFNDNGQLVDQYGYPQAVSVANEEDYQRLLRNGLDYILNFPISKAGAYQMRVAVRDSSSAQLGSASQFVTIPDLAKNQLAVSGIVLSGIEQTPANSASPTAGSAAAAADAELGPSVRRLRRGVMLDYRYNVFNAKLDNAGLAQIQTQMRLFREGKPVFTGKLQPLDASQQTNMKRLSLAGRLRVGPELTPGEYVLQVGVTDKLAPKGQGTVTQWIDFEITR